jgi:glycosyltransferase involved in cell wall biosynthesis
MPAGSAVSVSVIVPCRNAARHLREALESLVGQELDEPAEIILVDNGSTDDSRAVAAGIRGRIPLRIIDARARANGSYARNEGVRQARGDKLMFVDADDRVGPGYLAAMAAALESHQFVTSRVDSVSLNDAWIRDAHGPPWEGITVFFDFLPGTGINIGLRRSAFDRIGGFPEEFSGSQDIVFSWRAHQRGLTIVPVPAAVYLYRYRATLRGLFRQCRNWGTSNVLLYRTFRHAGMPPRTLRAAAAEWRDVLGGMARARSKAQLAPFVTRLGYCAGRLAGSIKYRCLYL